MINQKMYELGSKRSIIREIFEHGKKRAAEIGKENVFDFSLGNPSVEPPEEVDCAIKELLETQSAVVLHGYTSAQGDQSVREAIADDLNARFSANMTADKIYMTCGAAASLSATLKAVCLTGDEVVVFAPYFTEYKVFIENAGATLVSSTPKNDFQADEIDLERKITEKTKAVIVNSPNNPSGVVYTEETVLAIARVLYNKEKEYGHPIYLISDEPYRELVYGNATVPYLPHYYADTVICYSFSKSMSLPGERIGYIAVNPTAADSNELYLAVCGAGRSLGYVCAPSLFQRVVSRCLGAKINLSAYEQNRDLFYNSLTKMGFECVQPDGAFYLFVKAPSGNAYDFYEQAKRKEILLVPCDDFGINGFVRIAYCVDKSTIERSLPAFISLAKEIFG